MIIGTCPYDGCDGRIWLPMADGAKCPCYQKHTCEDCKRVIWTKHSRINPCSWTGKDFKKEFKINKKTRQIELRNPPKPLTKKEQLQKDMFDKMMSKIMSDYLIYGDTRI